MSYDNDNEADLEDLEAMVLGHADCWAECLECGYEQVVEPDADYPCHRCGRGRLVSPLVIAGIM